MRVRIHQLVVSLDYEDRDVVAAAAKTPRRPAASLSYVAVVRRSVDARKRRGEPVFVLSVEAEVESRAPRPTQGKVENLDDASGEPSLAGKRRRRRRRLSPGRRMPVAWRVGAGPAGLTAALGVGGGGAAAVADRARPARRAAGGAGRAVLERGRARQREQRAVRRGRGGAVFRRQAHEPSKDRSRVRRMFETLVRCGAPREILIDAEPHVGSDELTRIVPALRAEIIAAGGEVRFGARLDGLEVEAGRLRAVIVVGERIEASACVLATGHSARDTYRMLCAAGVEMAAKPFAVGLRAELPQTAIDRCQWGRWAGHPRLGAASFRLTRPESATARACYTFCMCPGGVVISCASEAGMLTTNGMSLAARDGRWGNAAFLAPVGPKDYPEPGPGEPAALAGLAFQAAIERRAFEAGGADYSLPAARLADFLAGEAGAELPAERSCKRSRVADLRGILPEPVERTLIEAMPAMLMRMQGASVENVTLYAAETRTSSPVAAWFGTRLASRCRWRVYSRPGRARAMRAGSFPAARTGCGRRRQWRQW